MEADDTFNAGLVRGADALSEGYVKNPLIRQYVNDPNCTMILFENPPYAETTSVEHQRKGAGKKSSTWKGSWVVQEMKREVRGTASNDLGNAFIWSGFRFYLRQPTDSYVVYSPVKYWKVHHLIDRRLVKGFAFNRRWFHTNIDACIMVALWANEEDLELESFEVEGFEYDPSNNRLVSSGLLPVSRIYERYSKVYYDKRTFEADEPSAVYLGYDGLPARAGVKLSLKAIYNDNMLGYMVIDGSNFDNPDLMAVLIRAGLYKGHGYYLRSDNYLEKLPMFCASRYITYNKGWTERARIMKSADGAQAFNADVASGKLDQWLLKCLLFTCLETQNHMRTLTGSDGRFYRNELCLDTTHGETVASRDLARLDEGDAERKLLDQWELLLAEARKAPEYDPGLTYGVYQIYAEIDTSYKDEADRTVWNNPAVHTAYQTLKALVKEYYNAEIVPTLFEYKFLV